MEPCFRVTLPRLRPCFEVGILSYWVVIQCGSCHRAGRGGREGGHLSLECLSGSLLPRGIDRDKMPVLRVEGNGREKMVGQEEQQGFNRK